jgi:8-oxo-dGTP diphosphatase
MYTDKLRDATLCFLVEEAAGVVHRVCLAMKKRGFATGKWNGVGGKVASEKGETVEEAAIRETKEEVGVALLNLTKMAELTCVFPHNPDLGQQVHVFVTSEWVGDPVESEEMAPDWFTLDSLPFADMWADEKHWLPLILSGKKVRARFVFSEGDALEKMEIDVVEELS